MAKQAGLGDQFFIDGIDLSGDVGALTRISAPSGLLEETGINKSAIERVFGQFDGAMEFNVWFNDASGQEHENLKAKGSGNDRIATWFRGSGIGNGAAALVCKQINYDWNRGADASLQGSVQCLGQGYGLDFCEQLTAGKRTDSAATNGASLDGVAASANGLAAYLHVFAFTGTSVTVKVQESSDDGAGDPFADVLTFTAATGVTKERKVTSSLTAAVERYLRVVTTGTFSNAVFAVCATRYPVQN